MKYIVECFNDQCLLEAYGVNSSYDIDHSFDQGREKVLEKLSVKKNKIGLIDYDKGIHHRYFDKCNHKLNISNEIDIYEDKLNNNIIIVFNRKLETMIVNETINTFSIKTAKNLKFNNTEGNYHNIRSSKEKLNNLRNLLQTIIQRSTELQKLRQFL